MPKAIGHRLRHNPHADAITDHFAKTVKAAHSDAIVQVVTEFGGMLTDVFLKRIAGIQRNKRLRHDV